MRFVWTILFTRVSDVESQHAIVTPLVELPLSAYLSAQGAHGQYSSKTMTAQLVDCGVNDVAVITGAYRYNRVF